jgi:Protein of unknown function (DUF559)
VIARRQLLALGFSRRAIDHRLRIGRLRLVMRGVYVVGRPELTRHGRWMAAVLACGPDAVLSHESAAALWGIRNAERGAIEVSVLARSTRRRPGITVQRRTSLRLEDVTTRHRIPVTSVIRTLIDLAPALNHEQLEAAINEAVKHDYVDPDFLHASLESRRGQSGVATLRAFLDRHTLLLTDSELERRFIPIASRAGLPPPLTQQHVSGFRVDFFWPELGLVVETDGLRYHRTPAHQARDRIRDQAHTAAGLTALRFTHAQVRYEPGRVEEILTKTARRLVEAKAS